VITVDSDIGSSIERAHYALIPSHKFSFSPDLTESGQSFSRDWAHLEPDPYMADGGSYRLRRYGLFRLDAETTRLSHIPGAAFYQSIEINPLNGGEYRHFAPLDADTVNNPFLHELIRFDFSQLTSNKRIEDHWMVGVHQIRITATAGVPGNPTPEGIHRDDETYTVQHLIARQNIDGGINYFYGNGLEPTQRPQVVWKQESYFGSYYFDRSVWRSVCPILPADGDGDAHRDILLIDFIASPRVTGLV